MSDETNEAPSVLPALPCGCRPYRATRALAASYCAAGYELLMRWQLGPEQPPRPDSAAGQAWLAHLGEA